MTGLVDRLDALDAKRTQGGWTSIVPLHVGPDALARVRAPMETLGHMLPADAAFAVALVNAWPEIRAALLAANASSTSK